MSVTKILNKIDPINHKSTDNLLDATKSHLGKIRQSYSEKFIEKNSDKDSKNLKQLEMWIGDNNGLCKREPDVSSDTFSAYVSAESDS